MCTYDDNLAQEILDDMYNINEMTGMPVTRDINIDRWSYLVVMDRFDTLSNSWRHIEPEVRLPGLQIATH